jgi:hypothetical protein
MVSPFDRESGRADPDYIGALKLLSESLLDTCQPGVS